MRNFHITSALILFLSVRCENFDYEKLSLASSIRQFIIIPILCFCRENYRGRGSLVGGGVWGDEEEFSVRTRTQLSSFLLIRAESRQSVAEDEANVLQKLDRLGSAA